MTGPASSHPTPDRGGPRPRPFLALALGLSLLLVAAACSGDADPATADPATTTAPEASCELEPPEPVAAVAVEGSDSDLDITSFDGTRIRAHWFPTEGAADEPAPTVLMGPGWSLAGDTSTEGAALFGSLSIGGLHDAGYNVLTWDPRGFGVSGGVVSVDDPEIEGRDTRLLMDWVAEQPEVELDAEGDPRMGMVGSSYGGGIQVAVAATDCRVDAIAPGLAWHSLETSLYKAETVKKGWAELLVAAARGADLDPHITSAAASGTTTGLLSDEDEEWFRGKGPADRVGEITAPTLFVQGTVDTLFTLDEAITSYLALREEGVPTATVAHPPGRGHHRRLHRGLRSTDRRARSVVSSSLSAVPGRPPGDP